MGDDLLEIIDRLEPWREMLRGVVAAFVADGFTQRQARQLAVFAMTQTEDAAGQARSSTAN